MTKYAPRTPGTHNKGGTHNPKAWEVWWVENLRFSEQPGSKSRPVIILSCDGTNVKYLQCTTSSSSPRRRYEIKDPEFAGLEHDGFVDLEANYINKDRLSRKLGILSQIDIDYLKESDITEKR